MVEIPQDVSDFLSGVFRDGNRRVAEKMTRIPTVHETSLDLTLIESLSQFAAPVRLESDWLVRIDTHFLGGRRHFHSWEIADIGVLAIIRRAGKVVRSKIALLQSKRLYPLEQSFDEDWELNYMVGFGRLFESDASFAELTEPRMFSFKNDSRYQALKIQDAQYEAIKKYEDEVSVPVYYLLYNPLAIPSTQSIPIVHQPAHGVPNTVGCRVLPAAAVRSAMVEQSKGYSPSFDDIVRVRFDRLKTSDSDAGWRLETLVTDLLLTCKTGYVAESRDDAGLFQVFNRRSGPISAAVAVTFDAP